MFLLPIPVPCQNPFTAATWLFEIGSGCSVVFVDHAAEASSASYGSIGRDDDGRVVIRRQLLSPRSRWY